VHRIAADLRPAMLDDLGLAPAIEWQLQRFRETTGAATELRLSHDELELHPRIINTLYRLIQECLTNVARHARASHVKVTLEHARDFITIEVADDGRGFAAGEMRTDAHAASQKTFGLMGLRERVHGLGGELSIESGIGRGTIVRARIPEARPEQPSA
jgi:signal transduction histidine kinase